jgi:hypothetical protein
MVKRGHRSPVINEREGMTPEVDIGTTLGVVPSIRDVDDDGEAKDTV